MRLGAIYRFKPEREGLPGGKWRCWDQHPDRGMWWLTPHDDEAREWYTGHGTRGGAIAARSIDLLSVNAPEVRP